ncbi:tRNA uridine-5-carboxymethylaminomethyl modification enzyme MnmG/GidA [Phycisphaera mikurensis]|uniref:tRNA uridine 5-carboxymethylaminomethyl modification enzyme MnmG n=1 Tax=Phycisphaera mikurensis (strain NBRC 102666 / KCTC 22515 / FYK2301M01) TaxID=1142394 RepID=I0IHB5_PHYMF|nr:FAD-dependent oxidoreductase [Phycisphaera mikurensis]MBB6440902.1 tRNA uridine 5-carboxymethylaminomethyl modification enzyme [Phycisphaera mikurensis]BAM04653.1 tRNA uridine 5-carboxymethylaminomethyl modification enzyme MnmG [Phycisphaera mikurensis NBRC 102666]
MDEAADVIVIGGGHAGAEAAWAASNLLRPRYEDSGGSRGRVAMVTMDPDRIGAMSCNPAIGGLAKGQMVAEIDALGGLMGRVADATGIQFKVLNRSRGPAVRGPRCQSDKHAYAEEVRRLLATRPNLSFVSGLVEELVVEEGRCVGVFGRTTEPVTGAPDPSCCGAFGRVADAGKTFLLRAGAVVLTTGTFMRALMHTGDARTQGGRVGEGVANGISAELARLGFELGRLKTGTPPRLARGSLDLSGLEEQPGDDEPEPFSRRTDPDAFPRLPQAMCWMTHTNEAAHGLIRANLHRAPMFNGSIEASSGPRYCPSIEDKVVRFADRTSHHVFLEPESLRDDAIYCNGISTSLPAEVQAEVVKRLPGCEHAEIQKPGYAVEYDMVWPHQIDATCMTKRLPGLLLAGQINGTSGYEEAAGQGLVAGVNAARWASAEGSDRYEPFRLGRDRAYIGVMLDDLVTKTPREPYRMFTSRAEHRLSLRADNAAPRLTALGREIGTVGDERWRLFEADRALLGSGDLAGRPDLQRHADAEALYGGYIARQDRQQAALAEREDEPLPAGIDFGRVTGLRGEAADVMNRFRPATLGQAGRLAGVNPTDVMLLSIAVRRDA